MVVLWGVWWVLFVVRSGRAVLAQYVTVGIAMKLRRSVKLKLSDRFLRAPYEEVSRQARGRVVHHINNPAETIYVAMVNLGHLIAGTFECVLMVGLMLCLSWWTTLLIGLLAGGGIYGWRRFADRRASAYGRTIYDLRAEQSKLDVEVIDGLKVVKAHTLEPRFLQQQQVLLDAEIQPTLKVNLLKHAPSVINETIASAIVLILGVLTFLYPSAGIRVSLLVAFLVAVRRLSPAMARVNGAIVELNRCHQSLATMEEILSGLPTEPSGDHRMDTVREIHLQNVTFAYAARPEQQVLKHISLSLHRETVTAIVGTTGAGKSTIAHLLLRFWDVSSGSILVNGIDLRQLDLAAWRQHVGYVSQDIYLFNTTIRENITLWDDVPEADVVWAAQVAQIHEFVTALPHQYETLVGDRGLRLSGGQGQRLAIARAILRKPDVLIFDEATSALDNVTERAVYSAIKAAHRDVIVLVIAHRLSTVKDADQILVLQDGRVVERGIHAALMRQGGIYAALYEQEDAKAAAKADRERLEPRLDVPVAAEEFP